MQKLLIKYLKVLERGNYFMSFQFSNWMREIPDNYMLGQISIPGTHDSGATYYSSWFGQCQLLSIDQQLREKGVRFLDIRCAINKNSLHVYHGSIKQADSLGDVIEACRLFLADNKSETVIISLKKELDKDSEEKFEDIFYHQYYNSTPSIWYTKDCIPILKDVRGKIILFRRYTNANPDKRLGINAQTDRWSENSSFTIKLDCGQKIRVQDVFKVKDGKDKFNNYIYPMLLENIPNDTLFLNFASAIGKLDWRPSEISNYINPRLHEFLISEESIDKSYGIILMDYIDLDKDGYNLEIAKKIICSNFKFNKNNKIFFSL